MAVVEFAAATPLLLVLLLSVFDLCRAFTQTLQLVNAISAAASYAISAGRGVDGSGLPALTGAITAIIRGSSPQLAAATVTVLYNNAEGSGNFGRYYCVAGSPPTWTSTGPSSTSCGDSVTSGKFATISVTVPYAPVVPTSAVFAGFTGTSDRVIVRIQ
ncbi:TadE/TadG family type IV pilus assembly protein [Methylobacterium sp. ID0610]|uniref:TadE/TadG family type IV pilus assembly protein n=1 Tax=Methylobacterium carpenticola TaxID=3344827 RepID=UPI0036AD90D2